MSQDALSMRERAANGHSAHIQAFNTDVYLHVFGLAGPSPEGDGALAACCDRCRYFERRLSRTLPDSDISRAHAASPRAVEVSRETAEVVRLARGYFERSGGLFDITMGTVCSLWDFHQGVVPSRLALSRALEHVGPDRVRVGDGCPDGVKGAAPTLAITDPETVLDLGGIAKGYIADDLAALLVSRGVERFALNLGGNVLVRGGKPGAADGAAEGGPWRIGIKDPFDPARHRAVVSLASGSVATSGAFERRFTRGGVTYHHILSPRDGMPVATDAASATVVSSRSIDCDGYATPAFMLGVEEGLAFVESLPDVEAVIIGDTGRVRWTSGLDGRIELL